MAYSIDPLQDDCYENTSVLKNKFGIRDEAKLNIMEQNITSMMIAKALIELSLDNVDFEFYKKLHEYVFSDIYEWAGKIRTINISKKATRFCDADRIDERGKAIFARLNSCDCLRIYKDDELIDKFTELYCDLNMLHPFREGNWRIQRLFLTMLLTKPGYEIDFSEIDRDALMIATIRSVSGDVFALRDIFKKNIKKSKWQS